MYINHILGKFHSDISRGHPKWWLSKGILPQIPLKLNSGLGFIVICPESHGLWCLFRWHSIEESS